MMQIAAFRVKTNPEPWLWQWHQMIEIEVLSRVMNGQDTPNVPHVELPRSRAYK